MLSSEKVHRLTLTAIFCGLVIALTFIPYTGYIEIPGLIAITTIHVPVILGALFLGVRGGAIVGGVWGVTCMIRAFLQPIAVNIPFQNPFVAVLPRILVGVFAALLFNALRKKLPAFVAALIAAAAGTLTNTVFVLSNLELWSLLEESLGFHVFGGFATVFGEAANVFQTIFNTIIAVNGTVEIAVALLIVPTVYVAVNSSRKSLS